MLGISFVHLCNLERSHAEPSLAMIDRIYLVTGIDVYALALVAAGPPCVVGEHKEHARKMLKQLAAKQRRNGQAK